MDWRCAQSRISQNCPNSTLSRGMRYVCVTLVTHTFSTCTFEVELFSGIILPTSLKPFLAPTLILKIAGRFVGRERAYPYRRVGRLARDPPHSPQRTSTSKFLPDDIIKSIRDAGTSFPNIRRCTKRHSHWCTCHRGTRVLYESQLQGDRYLWAFPNFERAASPPSPEDTLF